MKSTVWTVAACLALGALGAETAPVPEAAKKSACNDLSDRDACCLQLSILSPGFVLGPGGLEGLSLFEMSNQLPGDKTDERVDGLFRNDICPLDVGLIGWVRGRRSYSCSVALLATRVDDKMHPLDPGVVPTREECVQFTGVQAAGVFSQNQSLTGLQFAGLAAQASYVAGMQASVVFDSAFELTGIQASALLNESEHLHGVQLGPLNHATAGQVFQFGLVNLVSGSAKGVQLGLLNINHLGEKLPLLRVIY